MAGSKRASVLFVCMGNICRSPTAEAVFRHGVESAGLTQYLEVDSAGTHAYHVGEAPDSRAQVAAQGRGFDLSPLRGREVLDTDFDQFDYILAMDHENLAHLQRLQAAGSRAKLGLLLDYATGFEGQAVPDPYFGGDNGFTLVLDLVEMACAELLLTIVREHGLGSSEL